jgi:uncharacterized protein YidB (DUF937 family)
MGLLDVLNGMQNGPRGAREPGGGGMSPITMALLGLLAYKAAKSSGIFGGGQQQPATPGGGDPGALPRGASASPSGSSESGIGGLLGSLFGRGASGSGGGLSNALQAGLGSLLGGGAAGNVLSGGLGNLIKDLHDNGAGQAAQSWVGKGPNQEIAPDKLQAALGSDTLDALSQQTGMKRDDLLASLSQYLPRFIDHMTPEGRLPTEDEAARMV